MFSGCSQEAGVHSQLNYDVPLPELWARSQAHVVAGTQTRILSTADNLLHGCGHAFYSGNRASLQWVCDAGTVIARQPDLDWDVLLQSASRGRLAIPLSVMLSYLAEDLNAAMPVSVRAHLTAMVAQIDVLGCEIALLGAWALDSMRWASREHVGHTALRLVNVAAPGSHLHH
jgi:hypothetical protein